MSEAVENRATLIKEYEKKIDEFVCKPENLADFKNKVYSRELILLLREINKAKIIDKCNWEDKFAIDAIGELIVNKAIHESMFIEIYTDLCLVLHKAEENSEKENSELYFYRTINRNAQKSFEAIAYNDDKKNGDRKLLMIGILKFISHLYRVKLLNYKIIENCIVLLIRNAEDYDYEKDLMVEYSITFMETVGPLLIQRKEDKLNLRHLGGYVTYLERMKGIVSNRIKFMIIDLVEARDKKWSDKPKKNRKSLGL
uniref:MIF4G domain-containing protein n=1 Tax=Panagrolaimus davidi TaxID=227884 RepID=A0A914PKL0_9BILA